MIVTRKRRFVGASAKINAPGAKGGRGQREMIGKERENLSPCFAGLPLKGR